MRKNPRSGPKFCENYLSRPNYKLQHEFMRCDQNAKTDASARRKIATVTGFFGILLTPLMLIGASADVLLMPTPLFVVMLLAQMLAQTLLVGMFLPLLSVYPVRPAEFMPGFIPEAIYPQLTRYQNSSCRFATATGSLLFTLATVSNMTWMAVCRVGFRPTWLTMWWLPAVPVLLLLGCTIVTKCELSLAAENLRDQLDDLLRRAIIPTDQWTETERVVVVFPLTDEDTSTYGFYAEVGGLTSCVNSVADAYPEAESEERSTAALLQQRLRLRMADLVSDPTNGHKLMAAWVEEFTLRQQLLDRYTDLVAARMFLELAPQNAETVVALSEGHLPDLARKLMRLWWSYETPETVVVCQQEVPFPEVQEVLPPPRYDDPVAVS